MHHPQSLSPPASLLLPRPQSLISTRKENQHQQETTSPVSVSTTVNVLSSGSSPSQETSSTSFVSDHCYHSRNRHVATAQATYQVYHHHLHQEEQESYSLHVPPSPHSAESQRYSHPYYYPAPHSPYQSSLSMHYQARYSPPIESYNNRCPSRGGDHYHYSYYPRPATAPQQRSNHNHDDTNPQSPTVETIHPSSSAPDGRRHRKVSPVASPIDESYHRNSISKRRSRKPHQSKSSPQASTVANKSSTRFNNNKKGKKNNKNHSRRRQQDTSSSSESEDEYEAIANRSAEMANSNMSDQSRANANLVAIKEQIDEHIKYCQPKAAELMGISLSTLKRRFYMVYPGLRWPRKPWPEYMKGKHRKRHLSFLVNVSNVPEKKIDEGTWEALQSAFNRTHSSPSPALSEELSSSCSTSSSSPFPSSPSLSSPRESPSNATADHAVNS